MDEIRRRLEFLSAVGLDYLSLDRSAATLSGGEAQRIRLATQIGSKLRGVLYVLDEPSIGLHPRDNDRLLETLTHLRDMGNTVLVVEHDAETIERADYVIDLGPGAGRLGGALVAPARPAISRGIAASLTGQYLSGALAIPLPADAPQPDGKKLRDPRRARAQSEKYRRRDPAGPADRGHGRFGQREIDAGQRDSVSRTGAGNLRLARGAGRARCDRGHRESGQSDSHRPVADRAHAAVEPCHVHGLFTPIRDLYAMLPESRERGYKPGRFSFNVKGGRCEACQGDGLKRIEMNFLPDVYVTCDVCRGRRYNQETLQVKYQRLFDRGPAGCDGGRGTGLMENIPQITPSCKR